LQAHPYRQLRWPAERAFGHLIQGICQVSRLKITADGQNVTEPAELPRMSGTDRRVELPVQPLGEPVQGCACAE